MLVNDVTYLVNAFNFWLPILSFIGFNRRAFLSTGLWLPFQDQPHHPFEESSILLSGIEAQVGTDSVHLTLVESPLDRAKILVNADRHVAESVLLTVMQKFLASSGTSGVISLRWLEARVDVRPVLHIQALPIGTLAGIRDTLQIIFFYQIAL